MKDVKKYVVSFAVGLIVSTLFFITGDTQAQASPGRLAAIRGQLDQMNRVVGQLPSRRILSSSLQNMLQFADHFDQATSGLKSGAVADLDVAHPLATDQVFATVSERGVPVNNPATDFLYSILGGFTQYETSTAWCGNHVVVGFADSGSIIESLLSGPGGISTSGSAYSSDAGGTFRDSGFVNPGTNSLNQLQGNVVVNCADESTFYYTQIFATGTSSGPIASVAFSKSTDGGMNWAEPVPTVSLDARNHVTDKPWSALDHRHRKNIYVTYTDFDTSNTICHTSARAAIEVVHSIDGGDTWSAPATVDQVCILPPQNPIVQGSQVEVDSNGAVYVAWVGYTSTSPSLPLTREMRITKSIDHGATFGRFVKIGDITPVGIADSTLNTSSIFSILQGNVQVNEWPTIAVDRSGTKTDGTAYVAWNDARFLAVPDGLSLTAVYGYSDIVLSRSTDGGSTWSAPERVNSNRIVRGNGRGTDQFQPGASVDKAGRVAICWSDRSGNRTNYSIGRTCGTSTNLGATWTSVPVTPSHWLPIKSTDLFDVGGTFGDYNQLSSDFIGLNSGFVGAYSSVTTHDVPVPNQDVFLIKLPIED